MMHMMFWILSALPLYFLLMLLVGVWRKSEVLLAVSTMGLVLAAIFMSIFVCTAWTEQADDVGIVRAQSIVIAVYQAQVDTLKQELRSYHYPAGELLTSDAPIASIVKALTDAQNQLTEAEAVRAHAIVSIEMRRLGPMGGVISVVGDYK